LRGNQQADFGSPRSLAICLLVGYCTVTNGTARSALRPFFIGQSETYRTKVRRYQNGVPGSIMDRLLSLLRVLCALCAPPFFRALTKRRGAYAAMTTWTKHRAIDSGHVPSTPHNLTHTLGGFFMGSFFARLWGLFLGRLQTLHPL